MKASKMMVLAVCLAFLLGAVPSSIAWDGRVVPLISTPEVDDPEPITEGDPWDDNEDGGPDGANVGPDIIIVNQLGLPWWFTKYHIVISKVSSVTVDAIDRKVIKKRATTSK